MPRSFEPLSDDFRKRLGGHPAVAHSHNCHQALLARSDQRLLVAGKGSRERLLVFPLRVRGGERLYPVNGKGELKIDRLLSPQRAIVVEGGDALLNRDKLRRAFFRYLLDKSDDRFFWSGVVPRRQRLLRANNRGRPQDCDT